MMDHTADIVSAKPPARRIQPARLLFTFTALLFALTLPAAAAPIQTDTNAPQTKPLRDGSHDFDFNIGVWHTHIHRILDPFSDSSEVMILDGTVTVRKIWGGKAQLEEIEADGPKGHWEGMTLFLYNPSAHQWSQSFIGSKQGELGTPLIGEFHDGRGELYSSDTFNGKTILVHGEWSQIQPDSHRYQESYSNDGGKTWKPAFIGDLTRDQAATVQDGTAIADPPPADETVVGERDFDLDLGNWKTHSTRLLHPLTGSNTWVEMDGTTCVKKVWGGRANLAEYDATGTGGHVVLLSLRWFNPVMHEWNLDFATPQVGTLGVPGVGTFKNGHADFYDYEIIAGRSVLVRFSFWKITDETARSEQAFSDNGGQSWEVNWINNYTRLKTD